MAGCHGYTVMCLLQTLRTLPLNEARSFQRYLQGEELKLRAINRTFSALINPLILKYLAQNTENELGENYISRNVMEKLSYTRETVDAGCRADDVALNMNI